MFCNLLFYIFPKVCWYLWVIGLPIQKGWGRDLFLEYFRLSLEEFIDIFSDSLCKYIFL